MKTQHTRTPGPWKAEHSGTGDATVISDCGWTNKDGTPFKPTIVSRIDWPTAQLIASAPELLSALEAVLKECALVHKHWGEGCNLQQAKAAEELARAAIAKARGEA